MRYLVRLLKMLRFNVTCNFSVTSLSLLLITWLQGYSKLQYLYKRYYIDICTSLVYSFLEVTVTVTSVTRHFSLQSFQNRFTISP